MLLIFSLIVVYFQDLDCLGDACLAEENKFLIDVLDLLAEEMDSCENIDSGVEMEYEAPQTKKGENLLNFCKNCSSCIQKVIKHKHVEFEYTFTYHIAGHASDVEKTSLWSSLCP